MSIAFANSKPTSEELAAVATAFRGQTPQEYLDFLAQGNGGAAPNHVEICGSRRWRFMPVVEVAEAVSIMEDGYHHWGERKVAGSFPHVPIATDDQSNYLAYDLSKPVADSFEIWFLDHEVYPDGVIDCEGYRIAGSLNELLTRFTP